MNTLESNLTDSDQRELHAWCAEVRAAHASLAQLITAGDARLAELEKSMGSKLQSAGFTPDDLGELYFVHCGKSLPAWPLETPGWAVTTEFLSGVYPEMMVQFAGKNWETLGGFNARIEQMHTIFVDNFVSEGNVTNEVGEIELRDARVYIAEHPTDLSAEDALQLAIAIEDAATELRGYEAQ